LKPLDLALAVAAAFDRSGVPYLFIKGDARHSIGASSRDGGPWYVDGGRVSARKLCDVVEILRELRSLTWAARVAPR
jgi:hypothetical protein